MKKRTLFRKTEKLCQHPAATDPYKPEPHRYNLECDGTEGIRKTQKENLVYETVIRKK